MDENEISPKHPRASSLRIRARLSRGFETGVTSTFGLFAHGRGEAFDYLIGEETTPTARKAIIAAASALLAAKHPVISVNGNVIALTPKELVELAKVTNAKLEVNLYHRSPNREKAIANALQQAGAQEILGIDKNQLSTIPEIQSERRRVDKRGLLIADVAFIPLEDGDRTEALVALGKRVITVDLNPLSRTAQKSTITIVDNIVRAMPLLIEQVIELKNNPQERTQVESSFNNQANLRETILLINKRLTSLAKKHIK
jgi:4-phosphopantoate--beta-alanine ligase